MSDRPRTGDKVYDHARIGKSQPNGKIIGVISHEEPREYLVHFHDEPKATQDFFDENELVWSKSYGGVWFINEP